MKTQEQYPPTFILHNEPLPNGWEATGINSGRVGNWEYCWCSPEHKGDTKCGWLRIRNSQNAKYTDEFLFFLKHQIAVSVTNGGLRTLFFSRLEKRSFREMEASSPLSNERIKEICHEIFLEIKSNR